MRVLLTLGLMLSANAYAVLGSNYTNINNSKCTVITSSELDTVQEGDYLTAECPALGGYRVMVSGGDIRYSLDLSYEGTEIPMVKLPTFHDLPSSKIEWRYKRTSVGGVRSIEYTALIYRLNRQVLSEDGSADVNKDMLVVVRLKKEKSCVIGVVDQQRKMNKKALKIADNMDAKCIDISKVY